MTTIELEIDSLVLTGIDQAEAPALIAALRAELAAGLVSPSVHATLVARGDTELLGTSRPVVHSQGTEPIGLGRAAAKAVTAEVIR